MTEIGFPGYRRESPAGSGLGSGGFRPSAARRVIETGLQESFSV